MSRFRPCFRRLGIKSFAVGEAFVNLPSSRKYEALAFITCGTASERSGGTSCASGLIKINGASPARRVNCPRHDEQRRRTTSALSFNSTLPAVCSIHQTNVQSFTLESATVAMSPVRRERRERGRVHHLGCRRCRNGANTSIGAATRSKLHHWQRRKTDDVMKQN